MYEVLHPCAKGLEISTNVEKNGVYKLNSCSFTPPYLPEKHILYWDIFPITLRSISCERQAVRSALERICNNIMSPIFQCLLPRLNLITDRRFANTYREVEDALSMIELRSPHSNQP